MAIHTGTFELSTDGNGDVIDVTGQVGAILAESGAAEAAVITFVGGSTAAVTSMEFEPGGVHDLRSLLDRLIPERGDYEHNRLNHDSNSHAHQRASMIGPSIAVPAIDGRLALGTWQQIVLVDFDDRARRRRVVVQVVS